MAITTLPIPIKMAMAIVTFSQNNSDVLPVSTFILFCFVKMGARCNGYVSKLYPFCGISCFYGYEPAFTYLDQPIRMKLVCHKLFNGFGQFR